MAQQPSSLSEREILLAHAAAEHGCTVEYHDIADGPSPFNYRLAIVHPEHGHCAGVAWRTDDERPASVEWALEAVAGWDRPKRKAAAS